VTYRMREGIHGINQSVNKIVSLSTTSMIWHQVSSLTHSPIRNTMDRITPQRILQTENRASKDFSYKIIHKVS